MKRIYLTSAVFLMTSLIFSIHVQAIDIFLKIEFGQLTPQGNCESGNGICKVFLTTTNTTKSSAGADFEIINGEAKLKDGKLYVFISKEINERGKGARGIYSATIKENVIIEEALSKQLGVEKLSITPGNYECNQKTFVFNVKGPKDVSTGQSSGKRQH
ncbi:MAG: hypothetical protein JZU47_09210 [Prolixibacteraceae bacterium]|nr:hypothetical protein [Prolixibacteraceae bacterium]